MSRIPSFPAWLGLFAVIVAVSMRSVGATEEEEFRLSPIIAEGTAADVLLQDPIVPIDQARTSWSRATGSVDRSLLNELPFTVSIQAPGELSTFRGLGRSGEDTNVQALGIPLNSPQGGGFDLSIFPQFLWSEYRFQLGPSAGAFEPRSASGTLSLVPWSQDALIRGGDPLTRFTSLYSGAELLQASAAFRVEGAALVAGYTEGRAQGPSGAFSARLGARDARLQSRVHLLGTRWDAESRGSLAWPTPGARQLTARLMPVLQLDYRIDELTLLKSNFHADWMYVRYDDPGHALHTADRSVQTGFESALIAGNWQLGLAARASGFKKADADPPDEVAGSLKVSRIVEAGAWLVEPVAQLQGVSRQGASPAGSLGVRYEFLNGIAAFTRVAATRRYPNLIVRYYDVLDFRGNPELKPESSWSWVPGVEFRSERWRTKLQGYFQWIQDAQIQAQEGPIFIYRNQGGARMASLIHSVAWRPFPALELSNALTLSRSRVEWSGRSYPELPGILNVLGAAYSPGRWSAGFQLRASGSREDAAGRLPGYGYLDLTGRIRLIQSIDLLASLENVLDREIQFIRGYPSEGRVLTLGLSGHF